MNSEEIKEIGNMFLNIQKNTNPVKHWDANLQTYVTEETVLVTLQKKEEELETFKKQVWETLESLRHSFNALEGTTIRKVEKMEESVKILHDSIDVVKDNQEIFLAEMNAIKGWINPDATYADKCKIANELNEEVDPHIQDFLSTLPDNWKDIDVSTLEVNVRTIRLLMQLNINTIGELVKWSEEELLKCKNFGRKSLNGLKYALKGQGVVLDEKPTVEEFKL